MGGRVWRHEVGSREGLRTGGGGGEDSPARGEEGPASAWVGGGGEGRELGL